MEIEQYLYDLNESGDAIVAYTMRSASGASVQVCNMGATVLSLTLPDRDGQMVDVASGACLRGTKGILGDDVEGGVRFEERLWESRVEENRVVMSLSYETMGVGVMCEVVFDFDDEDSFEITYIAYPDAEAVLDFTHLLNFKLGESQSFEIATASQTNEIYNISGARPSILSEVGKVTSDKITIELLTSHQQIYQSGTTLATVSSPAQNYGENCRYVQKSVYRATPLTTK